MAQRGNHREAAGLDVGSRAEALLYSGLDTSERKEVSLDTVGLFDTADDTLALDLVGIVETQEQEQEEEEQQEQEQEEEQE